MKKSILLLFIIVCSANALKFSNRIRALGTDFAYLIPDYETDIYNDPDLLAQKLVSISFNPNAAQPLRLMALAGNFGFYGKYWPEYSYTLVPRTDGWHSERNFVFHFSDLWMLRVKNDVWNIANDGYYERREWRYPDNYFYSVERFNYFLKMTNSYRIGRTLKLNIKIGLGIYLDNVEENEYSFMDRLTAIYSARIGLFKRKLDTMNKFTTWYIDIGGPASASDMDSLPYLVYLYADGLPQRLLFANSFIAKGGWAKGFPVTEKTMFVIGGRNEFTFQALSHEDTDTSLRAMENVFSFPIAIEHHINKTTVRIGAKVFHRFINTRETDSNSIIRESTQHSIDYAYSFGLGWKPIRRLVIDLHTDGSLSSLRYWAIYVKYLF